MSGEGGGPHASDILIGSFIILFGLCITLVGGTCAAMGVDAMRTRGGFWYGLGLTGVFLAFAALGIFCIVHGVRTARSRYRD